MGLFIDDQVLEEQGGIQPLNVIHEKSILTNLEHLRMQYVQLFETDAVKCYRRSKFPRFGFGEDWDAESRFLKFARWCKEEIKKECGYLELSGYLTGDETFLRRVNILLNAFDACCRYVYDAYNLANVAKEDAARIKYRET